MLNILLYTGNYVIYEKKHIDDRDSLRISTRNKSVISAQTMDITLLLVNHI